MNVRFYFECLACGKYKVSKKSFMRFVPINSRMELTKKIRQGGVEAVIKFDSKCPKCAPKGASEGTIKILFDRADLI